MCAAGSHSHQFDLIETRWGYFGFVVSRGRLLATCLPQARRQVLDLLARRWPQATQEPGVLPRFQQEVRAYFEGRQVRFSAPLDLEIVPPFRRRVYEVCARIPYGRTASYADLARAAGNPLAVRAAGGAMAHNPLPLVVPCHRVIRSDGSIGEFGAPGGVGEKVRLLSLEGVALEADRVVSHRRRIAV